MKFGKLLKGSDRNLLLKFYFIFGSALIMIFFVIYSNRLIFHARKDAHIVPNLFARYFTLLTDNDWETEIWKDRLVEYIQEQIFQNIDYKIIVTDNRNEPIAWKNIDIDNLPFEYLDAEKQKILREELHKMHGNNTISLQYTTSDSLYGMPLAKETGDSIPMPNIFGYVYYSEPFSMKQLRYMPIFEMALVLVFVIFGLHGVFLVKKSEKDKLWIGLAKETAHQFGTPISSLLAWLDLLKMRIEGSCQDDGMIEMIDHMKADVAHLQKVVNRFGKIGSAVKLKPYNINSILEETIAYFNTRLPNPRQRDRDSPDQQNRRQDHQYRSRPDPLDHRESGQEQHRRHEEQGRQYHPDRGMQEHQHLHPGARRGKRYPEIAVQQSIRAGDHLQRSRMGFGTEPRQAHRRRLSQRTHQSSRKHDRRRNDHRNHATRKIRSIRYVYPVQRRNAKGRSLHDEGFRHPQRRADGKRRKSQH